MQPENFEFDVIQVDMFTDYPLKGAILLCGETFNAASLNTDGGNILLLASVNQDDANTYDFYCAVSIQLSIVPINMTLVKYPPGVVS